MPRRTMLINAKTDCFAYDSAKICRAVLCTDCSDCSFYKTARQLNVERKQTENRIEKMFNMSYKEFLLTKGYAK